MIDHITLHVSNAERSIAFYTKALSPLGYIPKAHHEPTIGFGVDDGTPRSDFYISPMDDPGATADSHAYRLPRNERTSGTRLL